MSSSATQTQTSNPGPNCPEAPQPQHLSNHPEALDAATSLLTGFTPQQLTSISKIVESKLKIALDKRLGPETSRAVAPAMATTLSGKRMSRIVSTSVKNAIVERPTSSATQEAAPVLTLSACEQETQPPPQPQSPPQSPQAQPTQPQSLESQQVHAHDFQSDDYEVKYRADYLRLPANAPRDHPHIVDIASVNDQVPQRGLGFADLVVTILFMYDSRVLNDFLDFNKHNFDFQRGNIRSGVIVPYIQRRIKFVTCGFLSDDGKAVNDSITYRIIHEGTGAWAPVSVQGPLCKTTIGARRIEEHVRSTFAKHVLQQKIWERKEDSKFIIKAR
ncbi:MAG: hypothetical protein Q9217_005521 [Psora testacea]